MATIEERTLTINPNELDYSFTTISTKEQGNGKTIWVVKYWKDGQNPETDKEIFAEVFTTDPAKEETKDAEKVVNTMTAEMAVKLFELILNNLDQIDHLKLQKLKEKLK